MPYTPTTWANQITALNATHMNNIESGVDAAPYGPDASSGDVAIADGIGGWTYSPLTLNGIGVPTGNVNMNSFGFTNLVSATSATGLTIGSGTGAVSGDLIFQTNSVERMRMPFTVGSGGSVQVGTLSETITAGTNGARLLTYATVVAPGSVSTTHTSGVQSYATVRGMSRSGPTDQYSAVAAYVSDAATVVDKTITGMSRSGTTVTVTTSAAHGFSPGDSIGIYGVTHSFNAEINGQFVVVTTPLTTTFTVTLAGLSSGSYGSGGTVTNRGSWYGYFFSTNPTSARGGLTGTAAHGDDIGAFVTYNADNTGLNVAGDNIYVAHNANFTGGVSEWFTGLSVAANVDYGVTLTGTINTAGIDLSTATLAAAATPAIFLPNMGHVTGLGADGVTKFPLFRLNASNHMELRAALELNDSVNLNFGTSTGTIIAPTTSQKFAFWGSTPVAQISGSTDVLAGLVTVGLRAASSNPPLNLGTGTLTAGSAVLGTSAATTGVLNIPNNSPVYGRNAAGDADVPLFKFDTSNRLAIQTGVQMGEGGNINTGTSTGTQFGATTSQKIAFYGATPIVQPTALTDITDGLVNLGLRATSNLLTPTIKASPVVGAAKDVQVFNQGTNQTWTKPVTGTIAVIIVKGGGGGGGGGTTGAAGTSLSGGGGGGAGGWLLCAVPLAALGATCNVNVGAGGAGGSAGNAGSSASGTTAFDSAGGNANVTAATGGSAGGTGSSTGGTGGSATAPTYSGYTVTSVATTGGTGGACTAGSDGTAAAASTGAGGAGGGFNSTGPASKAGGAGDTVSRTASVAGAGGAAGGGSATPSNGASPGASLAHIAGPQLTVGGGGGGGNTGGSGKNAGSGANGYAGGGGGGGGSCVTGGTAGQGGAGGDGCVVVLVY